MTNTCHRQKNSAWARAKRPSWMVYCHSNLTSVAAAVTASTASPLLMLILFLIEVVEVEIV